MEKINLRIDGRDIVAKEGVTILETALANKLYIPHLCYHPDLKPYGSCRLCVVEVNDVELVTSCRMLVKEGMAVRTKSPELDRVRRPIVEMLIANHHMDCRSCAKKGRCKLQRVIAYMHIDKKQVQRLRLPQKETPQDTSNPFFYIDHNKCVLCGICVRTCQEIAQVSAIEFIGRGYITKVGTFGDKPIASSRCESCGECVVRCPVGALVERDFKRPTSEIKTVCPYCGVGCGIYLGVRENVIVNVRGDGKSPVNRGNLCVKGRFGYSFINHPDRLTKPLIRQETSFREASWDEALEFVANKLRRYKGGQFALLASTKCTNEDNYIAQKFSRVVMGSNNIDSSVRLSQSPSIAALYKAFGIKAITNPLIEIEKSAFILGIGTNTTQSHPIIGLKIKKALKNGARLIVINPKEIELCGFAQLWLRPYPGTDVALLMGMCRVIVDEGLLDTNFIKEHCENLEEFIESLNDFPLGRVERITGVSREMITQAGRLYAKSRPSVILWSNGITQHSHGTDNVFALINLAMLTGNTWLYPLWGENNSRGACDMGCLPDFYPNYQPITEHKVRNRFETIWGVSLNPKAGLTITEIPDAIKEGKINALYIIGSDPVSNIAPSQKVRDALMKAEFIVIQDIFPNETTVFADVILPGASFAEKDGTFTNTEGRIQRVNKAIEPIGNSKPDWQIICELAKRLGAKGFDFRDPGEIASELASFTSEFPLWDDRWRFTPLRYRPPVEVTDIEYPLLLTTEKGIYGGGLLSQKVEGLNILIGERSLEINPKDARDFGIKDGEAVGVISRWGEVKVKAKVTDAAPPGVVIMGYAEGALNLLNPALEPVSKTLETKVCAVRVVSQT